MTESGRILLREIEEKDLQIIVRWRNTSRVKKHLIDQSSLTLSKQKEWFKKYIVDDSRTDFIIELKEDNARIGTIGLKDIDLRNRKAEFGVIIGDADYEGKGYAKEALFLLLKYGFLDLDLNKIYLSVHDFNERAINFYLKIGFVKDGVLRDDVFSDGRFIDIILMSMLRTGYLKRYS